jgi:hypothetical protein
MYTPDLQPQYTKLPYWLNVLVAIDQLGNAIADGNPDNTISARVGYFASNAHKSEIKVYWKTLEKIIDFGFKPIQGPGHCYSAWLAEADEIDSPGSYPIRIILGLFVAAGCLMISAFIRLAVFLNPRPGSPLAPCKTPPGVNPEKWLCAAACSRLNHRAEGAARKLDKLTGCALGRGYMTAISIGGDGGHSCTKWKQINGTIIQVAFLATTRR